MLWRSTKSSKKEFERKAAAAAGEGLKTMKFVQTAMERACNVKLIIFDVDGVLTDGNIHLSERGEVFKSFSVQDGLGIGMARKAGMKTAIITGRKSKIVEFRANELKIDELYQGKQNKLDAFAAIQKRFQVKAEEIAYIGDDFLDLPILARVGFAAAVGNAVTEVKERAHFISDRKGGDGAVRQIMEFLLKAQGRWEEMVNSYLDLEVTDERVKEIENIEQ